MHVEFNRWICSKNHLHSHMNIYENILLLKSGYWGRDCNLKKPQVISSIRYFFRPIWQTIITSAWWNTTVMFSCRHILRFDWLGCFTSFSTIHRIPYDVHATGEWWGSHKSFGRIPKWKRSFTRITDGRYGTCANSNLLQTTYPGNLCTPV